jgi:hypothetical protein
MLSKLRLLRAKDIHPDADESRGLGARLDVAP